MYHHSDDPQDVQMKLWFSVPHIHKVFCSGKDTHFPEHSSWFQQFSHWLFLSLNLFMEGEYNHIVLGNGMLGWLPPNLPMIVFGLNCPICIKGPLGICWHNKNLHLKAPFREGKQSSTPFSAFHRCISDQKSLFWRKTQVSGSWEV